MWARPLSWCLGRLAGELVRLVPEIGERVQGLSPPVRSDPETERYRLLGAVAAWLGAVSESVPAVFVIEDLHWATKPTLLLLSHLLRSDEDLRLLLVVTFRDTPLDMTADLIDLVAELLRLPGVERVRLAGLSESGVGALMEAQADQTLDDEGWALARSRPRRNGRKPLLCAGDAPPSGGAGGHHPAERPLGGRPVDR